VFLELFKPILRALLRQGFKKLKEWNGFFQMFHMEHKSGH
jgi:hypothetical protein